MQSQTATIAKYPRLFTISSSPDQSSSLETVKRKVKYSEYQSFGEPHRHLGVSGDIYVDLTKGNHVLYGKAEDGWRRWPGPHQRTASVSHPSYPLHILCCRVESKSLGWVSRKAITGRILVSSASQVIALILSHRISLRKKELKQHGRPRLSDASNGSNVPLFPSRSAVNGVATDVLFSVPPAPNAVPEFIDRSSIPDYHPRKY
ncbi:hypothetical protein F5887DRAFT_751 [Amanita rubescens]|nr:hypothetical protein F5887DRAFT_751 [Amanita rubescens]